MLKEKAKAAAVKYLQMVGYEILERDFDGFIVAIDLNTEETAFINVTVSTEDFIESDHKCLRNDFEETLADYLIEFPEPVDYSVRCDEIAVRVISKDRGIVRHCVNILGGR